MKINNFGEFAFIDRISKQFLSNLPKAYKGIGDDCAVIPFNQDEFLLVTTDMLIEDSHFLLDRISAPDLGYKSLAVNLSDIAAMAGKPQSAYISLGIPAAIEVEWMDEFYNGLKGLATQFDVKLLGGDTTRSQKHLIINIAVLGTVNKNSIKYRSTARPGDVICLTGYIGDSGGGLQVLLHALEQTDLHHYLLDQHHRPRPHVEEGIWLGNQKSVHALIDVSDGIDSDLKRIMEQSRCGVVVDIDRLPISEQLNEAAKYNGWDAQELAVSGGEDYCLLLSVAENQYDILAGHFSDRFARPLFRIGYVTEKTMQLRYELGGRELKLKSHGFDHFSGE